MNFVPLRKAEEFYGMSANTLRKYAELGKFKAIRTPANRWMFAINVEQHDSRIVCYCRVSSAKQKDDLVRQVVFMRKNYPEATIIQDIGSGLNFKRKGLTTILEQLAQGTKLTLVVAHKDRLARFGFELINYFVKRNGGELLVLDKTECSPQKELVEDLLAILTVFSCRMHGLRRYTKKIEEDSNLSQ